MTPRPQPPRRTSRDRPLATLVGLVVLVAAAAPTTAAAAAPTWKAGAAAVVITPEKPVWMAGYASRDHPAEGKETDLHGKALALEDERGARLVVVTLDLIGIPGWLRDDLARRCGEAYKLPSEGLLVNASHTHSGPEFEGRKGPVYAEGQRRPDDEDSYAKRLGDKLFQLVGDALADLKPASLGYSHARAGFAMNRRLPSPGGYRNSPYPDGPVDQAVPVLRVAGADGKLRAVLFGYACHNTTLALYDWNADYAGYAQTYLEQAHPGATALFLMGCGGDQNPYPRGTVELCRQHGRALANAVETALSVAPRDVRGPLRTALANVDIDYDDVPTRADLEKRAASDDKLTADHAKRFLAKLDAGEKLPRSYPCPAQVVRFDDDLLLIAIGGETLVDYSLRLKRELADDPAAVWIAGYSNDVMGYLPSSRVLGEGGYEPDQSMLYSPIHPSRWAPSLEDRIVAKVHELNQALKAAAPKR